MSYETAKNFVFTWRLFNYFSKSYKENEALRSEVFSTEMFDDTKCFLEFFYRKLINGKFYSCFLYRNTVDNCEKDVTISFTIEMFDLNGKIIESFENKDVNFAKDDYSGEYDLINIDSLLPSENQEKDAFVIRCNMVQEGMKQEGKCEARTEIQMRNCFYEWNIQFPYVSHWSKKLFFPRENSILMGIYLSVSDDKVLIELKSTEQQSSDTHIYKVKISAFKNNGDKIKLQNDFFFLNPINRKNSLVSSFTGINEIATDFTCSYYFFTLRCDVSVSTGIIMSEIKGYKFGNDSLENVPNMIISPRLNLQDDLHSMFLKEELCDIKLKTVDKVIPVHSCLLAARSPVFSAMFKQDVKETRLGVVDILGIETEVMQSFLEYLYSETLTNSAYEHILKLILVADKYQVLSLKERCSRILGSALSVENVCKAATVADLINDQNLQMHVVEFTKKKKNEVLFSSEWSELVDKSPELTIEILTKLAIDCKCII